jgi:capsular exopolysaccharide synthesis family protein
LNAPAIVKAGMSDHSRIDFWTFLFILRQRWALILGCGLVAAVLAFGVSLLLPERYNASADLLFANSNLDAAVLGSSTDESQTAPERVAATNLELASLQVVAENTRRRLGTSLTVRQLQDRLSIKPKGQADIVTVTATAPTRDEAVRLANTFAEEVEAFRRQAAQDQVQRAIDALRLSQASEPSTRGAERLEQLRAIKEVEAGDVTIVQRAVPPRDASSPRPLRNTVIGGLLGLLLGVFVALLFHRIDPRVRDDDEFVRIVGAPVLARVPDSRHTRRGQAFEALQFLRTNMQLQDPGRETRVIAVTSPQPGEGKTMIAGGLAEALALAGERVVAIDCDLRDPALHQRLEVEQAPGLTNALLEMRNADDLLAESPLGPRVLTAGTMPLDPLLTVPALVRLPDLLNEMREQADYVILDTPPISVAADASAVASMADGVIVVVDRLRSRRDLLAAAREQLAHARARVLGIVVNRAPTLALAADYAGDEAPEQKIEVRESADL